MTSKDVPDPNEPPGWGPRNYAERTHVTAYKVAAPALTMWERMRGQGHNFLGMAMLFSIFVLSTTLVSRDKEIMNLKKQLAEQMEENQERREYLKRHVKSLQEGILSELDQARNGKDLHRRRARVQELFEEHFPDYCSRSTSA